MLLLIKRVEIQNRAIEFNNSPVIFLIFLYFRTSWKLSLRRFILYKGILSLPFSFSSLKHLYKLDVLLVHWLVTGQFLFKGI